MAKVLVSLSDTLLRRIDRTAQTRGMTRSTYLVALAERDTAEQIGPGALPEVRRALAEIDELLAETPPGDSTQLIRAQRDARCSTPSSTLEVFNVGGGAAVASPLGTSALERG